MRLVLLALLALTPAVAQADDLDAMLRSCAGGNTFCEQSRKQFRDDWRKANRRDYQAQRNVAYCLLTSCDGAVAVDRPHGCAWRAVILVSGSPRVDGTDRSNFDSQCRGRLSASEASQFSAQSGAIFRRVYRRSMPPLI